MSKEELVILHELLLKLDKELEAKDKMPNVFVYGELRACSTLLMYVDSRIENET